MFRAAQSAGIRVAILLAAACALAAAPDAASAQTDSASASGARQAYLLAIRGAIGPSTSDYIERGLDKAQDAGAALVILEMDTPGGLDTSMRRIIKAILASSVPVATFVHPSGSRAASAGAYILLASHIAAMAPATNVGAATPVALGGGGGEEPESSPDDAKPESPTTEPAPAPAEPPKHRGGSAMERKSVNDAVAYIRSLAEMRGRNADWAERAVRDAESISAEAALDEHVIDLVATDVADLLRQLDGRDVQIATGQVHLDTGALLLTRVEPDWRTRLLDSITNPNVAYLLLLVGIYGLIFEGYNPGAVLPGVVGAISLLLAAYALQLLDVNYAGFGLIALGILLMIAEMFMPSFGSLGIGGVVSFVIGSIILVDTDAPGFGISRGLIGGVAFVGACITLGIIWLSARARVRPVVTGREQLLGAVAVAQGDFAEEGYVRVRGELWEARVRRPVHAGDRLRIVAVDGLHLEVEPLAVQGDR